MKNKELRKWIRERYEGEKFRFRPDQDQNIIGILDRKCKKPRPIICYKDDLVPMRGRSQNNNQRLRDRIFRKFKREDMLFVDNMDEAVIGVVVRKYRVPAACYDRELVIRNLMDVQGMSDEGAWEWYDYNIIDAYMGTGTPCFLTRIDWNKEEK